MRKGFAEEVFGDVVAAVHDQRDARLARVGRGGPGPVRVVQDVDPVVVGRPEESRAGHRVVLLGEPEFTGNQRQGTCPAGSDVVAANSPRNGMAVDVCMGDPGEVNRGSGRRRRQAEVSGADQHGQRGRDRFPAKTQLLQASGTAGTS